LPHDKKCESGEDGEDEVDWVEKNIFNKGARCFARHSKDLCPFFVCDKERTKESAARRYPRRSASVRRGRPQTPAAARSIPLDVNNGQILVCSKS
jgi:hypothetical protein